MSAFSQEILSVLAAAGKEKVDWPALEKTPLGGVLQGMAATMQNPEHHGEGDVYSHTKAVCEALIGLKEYRELSEEHRQILFLGALLHDIGKIRCTKRENGVLVSPHHCAVGALMARELLWRDFRLCGTKEKQALREAVCALIRYHSLPMFAAEDPKGERKLLKAASTGSLAKGFSLELLCLLEQADVLGRISKDSEGQLESIALCRLMAEELGCEKAPYSFASPHSQRAYYNGRITWRDQELFDDTRGEVILLSGLPGTGKDTWIRANCPGLPVISLDEIRRELGITPTEAQGAVVAEARQRARGLLREGRSFVWNATNVTAQVRANQISLFEQYGARVTTVFLETEWQEGLRRNAERQAQVPQAVIERLLSKLEIPEPFECTQVRWECAEKKDV